MRRPLQLLFALLTVAVLLAGCTTSVGGPDGGSTPPATRRSESSDPEDVEWALEGCSSSVLIERYPVGAGRGTPPPGWEFDLLQVQQFTPQAVLTMMVCDRVDWLGHAAGPVSFLFDEHTNYTAPEGCETRSYLSVLSGIWVDDDALVKVLQDHGLPAAHVDLEVQQSGGTPAEQLWAFKTEFGESSVRVLSPTGTASPDYGDHYRMAAWDGQRLTFIQVDHGAGTRPDVTPSYFLGTLAPGFAMTGDSRRDIVGVADVTLTTKLNAELRSFSDTGCQHPTES